MSKISFLQHLETFGYYPLPRTHADSPGYSGLLVVVRKKPQDHEPERIQLRLHDWTGNTSMVNLHADIDEGQSYIVCPGRISIQSLKEREVTFYSFGGSIESEVLAEETIYSLRSTAPVLELVTARETSADLLADEAEILIAETMAQQRLSTDEMQHRLVKAGPEAVYLAVLQSLVGEDEESAVAQLHPDLFKVLQNEQKWYKRNQRWPVNAHNLASLVQDMGE